MFNEDLKEYKAKLLSFSKEELKKRDIYLRKLAVGEIHGPKVGYPTIDKPWFQYMTEEDIVKEVPVQNLYQELYENNKDFPNQNALLFFGAKIKYKDLFNNIDKVTKALVANGVKKGDYITVISVGIPEVVYAFYACARIGAVMLFLNPFSMSGAAERIDKCNSKMAILMDKFYSMAIDEINDSKIENVVLLPTLNSSVLGKIKKSIKPQTKKEILWNSFVRKGNKTSLPPIIPFESQMPVACVCSSGSTGKSKAVVLTHDSFENSAHAYPKCDVSIHRGDLCYQVIPTFVSTGISTSINMPLLYGGTVFMDPRFDKKVFVKNNLKYNPVCTVATTSLFCSFLEDSILPKKGNMSNYRLCFQGGEKIEMKDKLAVEAKLRQYNSSAKLMNGYGQCECGAGITTQTPNTPSNVTAGIPIPGVTICIVDQNKNEVPTGERGEILVNTPCSMKEYLDNPEETRKFFYYDENNVKWNRTGDCGFINNNGELTVHGRTNDFSVLNGKKIYNFDVEDSIRKLEFVQSCDVFTDDMNEFVAHIILKDGITKEHSELIDMIQNQIYIDYADLDFIPEKYKFRDTYPSRQSNKRDVKAMKAETEGFIYVDKHWLLKKTG